MLITLCSTQLENTWLPRALMIVGAVLIAGCVLYPSVRARYWRSEAPVLSVQERLDHHLETPAIWGRIIEAGAGTCFVGCLFTFGEMASKHGWFEGRSLSNYKLGAVCLLPGAIACLIGCYISEGEDGRWNAGAYGALVQLLTIGGASLNVAGFVVLINLGFGSQLSTTPALLLVVVGVSLYMGNDSM